MLEKCAKYQSVVYTCRNDVGDEDFSFSSIDEEFDFDVALCESSVEENCIKFESSETSDFCFESSQSFY